MLEMESVLKALRLKQGKATNLEAFRREAVERFEDIGWVVQVDAYTTTSDGVIAFDVSVVDRCERLRHGNDYERMQWEVRNDILEIEPDKKGVTIPFSPDMLHSGDAHSAGADHKH